MMEFGVLLGAAPAAWWIVMNAQNDTDKNPYSKLASCVPSFHPYVWTEQTTCAWAAACLTGVEEEMREQDRDRIARAFSA